MAMLSRTCYGCITVYHVLKSWTIGTKYRDSVTEALLMIQQISKSEFVKGYRGQKSPPDFALFDLEKFTGVE